MLARVYAGYKRISLIEKRRGQEWGAARRRAHHTWSAERFYDTAIRNQGMLIKTSQFLSGRPDVMPEEYVAVLSRLQDEVPPEPFAVIERTVERELGRRLSEVFADFDETPIASASLAQVHRALLRDGREAAVKVQYPGIEDIVHIDLRNLRRFVAILNRLDRTLDFRFLTDELSKMVPKELDFINEGRNAEMIAANFAGVEDVLIPRIYWEHSTGRVLTMEYLEGVKITDIEAIRAMGVDTSDVAKILSVAFSEMILDHGIFHADPHPGNLLVAPGPRLIFVDFGQVKVLGPGFRELFVRLTRALVDGDDAETGRSFRDMGFRMKLDTEAGYEQLGQAYMGRIVRRMNETGATWAEGEMFRESYQQIMSIVRANPLVAVPGELLFVGRVVGLLNGLSKALCSRTNLMLEMARLIERAPVRAGGGGATATPRRLLET
jgi:predicted unusual protein kinase regulating ubiquinone biosynthesis (AarF/ABC1/UbiB family)